MKNVSPGVRLTILILFWALVAVFAFAMLTMLAPDLRDVIPEVPPDLMLWQGVLLFGLGIALSMYALRSPVERLLKRFLLLTGASAAGIVLGAVLHNLLYALAMLAEDVRILAWLLNVLEVAFFLAAVIVCPIAFVIGAAGVIVLLVRGRHAPGDPSRGGSVVTG